MNLFTLTMMLGWVSLTWAYQSSSLNVETSWPGGMTAEVCVDHNMNIDCGWAMEIVFSKPLTSFETWRSNIKRQMDFKGGTKVILRHKKWSKVQPSPSCQRFNAYYSGSVPEVTAKFLRVCSGDSWGKADNSPPPTTATAAPTPEPQTSAPGDLPNDADYRFYTESSWNVGIYGQLCLYHTAPITCGFEAEIMFSPPVHTFDIWSMGVYDEIRTDNQVTYKLRPLEYGEEQPNNPQCHNILVHHDEDSKPTIIAGRYTMACHNDEINTDPNQGGTVPPTTIPTTENPQTTTKAATTSAPTSTTIPTTENPQTTTKAATTSAPTSTTIPTTENPQTTTKAATTSAPASTTITTRAPSNLDYDYYDALQKSMQFYFVQRSGPINDEIIPWRTLDSAMDDGSDIPRDLVGGWYDAGDHVKFNFPMAASTTTLLWGFLKWADGYQAAGRTAMMYELVKTPLDYFLKCWDNDNQILYGQVGDGHVDHATWGRPEDMTMDRPTFFLDRNNPGSDLAGETAAALAAGAIAFKTEDADYAEDLLTSAEQVYDFADKYRRMYHESIQNAASFYRSWSGYYDELCWGAAWLLKATGDEAYRAKAQTAMNSMDQNPSEYSWDSKSIGCYMLMYELSSGAEQDGYRNKITTFMNNWVNFQGSVKKTPCGLAYYAQWGSLRYAANAVFIGLLAAEDGIEPTTYRTWGEKQIKYMLGANQNQFSYLVGFGDSFPLRPHHQSATCPLGPAPCDWNTFNNPAPNAHELTGALVGGPGGNDEYTDDRTDYIKNEVTTDYNAGFQSALAGLIHLDQTNQLPNAAPQC